MSRPFLLMLLAASPRSTSLTRPASTCCLSTPPPQEWKMSGGVPAWVTVVSFALKASFSNGVILISTPALAVWKSLARLAQVVSIGSTLEMCHQSMLADPPPSPESPDPSSPQPPSSTAPAPRPARPRTDLRLKYVGVVMCHPFG